MTKVASRYIMKPSIDIGCLHAAGHRILLIFRDIRGCLRDSNNNLVIRFPCSFHRILFVPKPKTPMTIPSKSLRVPPFLITSLSLSGLKLKPSTRPEISKNIDTVTKDHCKLFIWFLIFAAFRRDEKQVRILQQQPLSEKTTGPRHTHTYDPRADSTNRWYSSQGQR